MTSAVPLLLPDARPLVRLGNGRRPAHPSRDRGPRSGGSSRGIFDRARRRLAPTGGSLGGGTGLLVPFIASFSIIAIIASFGRFVKELYTGGEILWAQGASQMGGSTARPSTSVRNFPLRSAPDSLLIECQIVEGDDRMIPAALRLQACFDLPLDLLSLLVQLIGNHKIEEQVCPTRLPYHAEVMH